MKINKSTTDKIFRFLLRSLPIVSSGPELYDIFKDLQDSKNSINNKIDRAYQSLRETSNLVEELQQDLTDRTKKIEELREKYDNYAKLAGIEEEKIGPLLKQIDGIVNKGKNTERIVSFIINIIAGLLLFILGIWLGPKLTNFFK